MYDIRFHLRLCHLHVQCQIGIIIILWRNINQTDTHGLRNLTDARADIDSFITYPNHPTSELKVDGVSYSSAFKSNHTSYKAEI